MRQTAVFLLVILLMSPLCLVAYGADNILAEVISSELLDNGMQKVSVKVSIPPDSKITDEVTLMVLGDKPGKDERKITYQLNEKYKEGYLYHMENTKVSPGQQHLFEISLNVPPNQLSLEDSIYIFTGSSTLAVRAKKNVQNEKVDITVRVGPHGRVKVAGDEILDGTVLAVEIGSIVRFELLPERGYLVDGVSVNGQQKSSEKEFFTTERITSDTLILFSFWQDVQMLGSPVFPAVKKGEDISSFSAMDKYTPPGYLLLEYGLLVNQSVKPEWGLAGTFPITAKARWNENQLDLFSLPVSIGLTKRSCEIRPYVVYFSQSDQKANVYYAASSHFN